LAFAFPAVAGTHLLFLPTPEGRKAELAWVAGYVGEWHNLPARRQSPIPLLNGLNVAQLDRDSGPTRYCYTKPSFSQKIGWSLTWS